MDSVHDLRVAMRSATDVRVILKQLIERHIQTPQIITGLGVRKIACFSRRTSTFADVTYNCRT